MTSRPFTLADLERIVASRGASPSDTSYTAKLLAGGAPLAAKKLGEEAVEVVIASLQAATARRWSPRPPISSTISSWC